MRSRERGNEVEGARNEDDDDALLNSRIFIIDSGREQSSWGRSDDEGTRTKTRPRLHLEQRHGSRRCCRCIVIRPDINRLEAI
jgi:hypothetical protein